MSRYINYANRNRVYLLGKVEPRVNDAAEILRDEIQAVMRSSTPSGRMYGSHQASAPGQPPAIDTAAYIDSWKVDPAQLRRTQVSAAVYSDFRVEGTKSWILAMLLEYGTDRMLPRPHIRVALANVRALIRETISGG